MATIYTGRKVLYTNATALSDITTVRAELSRVIPTHQENAAQIQFLMDYFKGYHPDIVNREKSVRADIDYKITVNYAQAATRDIIGYYLAEPISYVPRNIEQRDAVRALTEAAVNQHKDTVDYEVAENQSICGVGYKAVFPDTYNADNPFKLSSLDPRFTFVVYSNELGNEPVWCASYYSTGNYPQDDAKDVYTVWDRERSYVVVVPSGTGNFEGAEVVSIKRHLSGGLPIVEFPNNQWRLGDWETSLALMDAIDAVASDSVNDIAQFVQSFLVFMGAELPPVEYDDNGNVVRDPLQEMRKNKLISIVPPAASSGGNVDVKYISNTLSSSNVSSLRDYLEAAMRSVIGVPDRKNRSGGGGGDTGEAVFMRDGWQDIDLVASNKEMFAVKAERRVIEVMINLSAFSDSIEVDKSLKSSDVFVKFSRNKSSNILTKAQAYATLTATETMTPEDCLAMVDLTTDEGEVIDRGEAYWTTKKEEAFENQQRFADNTVGGTENTQYNYDDSYEDSSTD